MKDFGYDIEDFYKIADEYGTLEDLHGLVEEGRRLGIRILLDFVPNHSSNLCEWFIKSANRTPGFENYYVWHPGKVNGQGQRIPPSNWV
jgi:alpha-glucosidase